MGTEILSTVEDYPYLGVTLSSKLSWKKHITNVTTKANRIAPYAWYHQTQPQTLFTKAKTASIRLIGPAPSGILLNCLEPSPTVLHQSTRSNPEKICKICQKSLPTLRGYAIPDRECNCHASGHEMGISPDQTVNCNQNHDVQNCQWSHRYQQS